MYKYYKVCSESVLMQMLSPNVIKLPLRAEQTNILIIIFINRYITKSSTSEMRMSINQGHRINQMSSRYKKQPEALK